ncbi:unnamed protein product [Adineta steineri]|uniref:Uncharacterized protein n=1 Tax=Adineta steineri TaxID=433720 RepID=A0A814ICT1_9BILA|nr:unnamed protein product [Adineta steineri]CAF1021806.1 unnamed protein product [Adineta steineri]CAF1431923.1 unnamed protein product [Adineta steineri]
MNTKKKSGTSRLPSMYYQTLLKSEFDYRRDMRRKLNQIQIDNRDAARRRNATDHVFAHGLLTKRHQWFNIDKAYRDTCRTLWNRKQVETGRTSHIFLPSIYPADDTSLVAEPSSNRTKSISNESPVIANERIKQNFLRLQPVMLEIIHAPHSSDVFRKKQNIESRKRSAYKRQATLQKAATTDDRYTHLIDSLEEH